MKKFALVMLLMLGMCAVASSAFASVRVAPEPISGTLFLLGGAGLAISRMFGKKNGK